MKRSHAPDPIKMSYYEVQFGGSLGETFEERLNGIREIGRKAAEEFPGKYHSLKDWFSRYDQLAILSFSFYYFMLSPAGYDEEAVTGGLEFPPHYLELLQAFALTVPRSYDARPFSQEVAKFKEDFKEIGELDKLRHYNFPPNIKNKDDLFYHQLRVDIMSHTIAVRNWSFEHQMKAITLSLGKGVQQHFVTHHGFDPVIFLELLYTMCDEIENRVNEHRRKTAEIMRPKKYLEVIAAYESLFPVIKSSHSQKEQLWTMAGKNLKNLQAIFLMHSDMYIPELLAFDYSRLEILTNGKLNIAKLKEIFSKISFEFNGLSDFNTEHFLLGNPILEKPFININDEGVFTSLWSILPHLSIGILEEFCSENEALRNKYNGVRAVYLEEQVEKLFRDSFPRALVFSGSKYVGKDNKEYENDLLVIIDNFALVIEAKSGQISPSAKRGAPDRLFKTLQELIDNPSEQALRFIEYLKDNPQQLSLGTKKGPNNNIDAKHLKYFIPLGVTLSNLSTMATNLKQMIRAGVTEKSIEELAPSVNLMDLRAIFDLLPLTAQKIHYLQRRREMEANIEYIGDEMDLLAWYMDNGFNLGPDRLKYGLFNVANKSKELDNYLIGSSEGDEVIKPALAMTKWWKDMLERMEKRRLQSWLENSYILLNIPIDGQEVFEEQLKDKREEMRSGKAEFPHNWILMGSQEEERRYLIAGYLFGDEVADARKDIMEDILFIHMDQKAKGRLVIGTNIDTEHYPYTTYGCTLSAELFDNKYLKMVRTDNTEGN